MISWMRVRLDTTDDYMAVLAVRASALGATTRAARVELYAEDALTSGVLSALESGARSPAAEEREALRAVGERLGWMCRPEILSGLRASGESP